MPSWMLDEMAHAGTEHLDAAFIAGFDRKQGYPSPDDDIAAFTARGLGKKSVVVDLGAGTGAAYTCVKAGSQEAGGIAPGRLRAPAEGGRLSV